MTNDAASAAVSLDWIDGALKQQLLAAFVIASVAGTVWLACRVVNPNQDVEHYYQQKHKPLYYLIKLCYGVIFAAAIFNARFIVSSIVSAFASRHAKKASRRS